MYKLHAGNRYIYLMLLLAKYQIQVQVCTIGLHIVDYNRWYLSNLVGCECTDFHKINTYSPMTVTIRLHELLHTLVHNSISYTQACQTYHRYCHYTSCRIDANGTANKQKNKALLINLLQTSLTSNPLLLLFSRWAVGVRYRVSVLPLRLA